MTVRTSMATTTSSYNLEPILHLQHFASVFCQSIVALGEWPRPPKQLWGLGMRTASFPIQSRRALTFGSRRQAVEERGQILIYSFDPCTYSMAIRAPLFPYLVGMPGQGFGGNRIMLTAGAWMHTYTSFSGSWAMAWPAIWYFVWLSSFSRYPGAVRGFGEVTAISVSRHFSRKLTRFELRELSLISANTTSVLF